MLQYQGTRQAPRKYHVPGDYLVTSAARCPCNICLSRIWTPELFLALSRTPTQEDIYAITYRVSSQELRNSVLEGCKFCRTIADGIHGRVFLDELYERFEKTDSFLGSSVPGDEEVAGSGKETSGQVETEAEEQLSDASGIEEEDIKNDVIRGWDAWEDRDTLARVCTFTVELVFDREEAGLFTFVNAVIEATAESEDADEPNKLQNLRGEDAVKLQYHINVDGNETENERRLFPILTSNNALGSDVNMTFIADWMQKSPPSNESSSINALQVPARLIDLQNKDNLRIVETSSIPLSDKSFVALSYVWGTNQTFILLSTTKDQLMTGFRAEQLPKTIQDAIIVSRRIGLRYIWVDALCIMQDSNDDKARELPKMRLIYKCAAVTIVAAVAKSATEGFLDYVEDKLAYFVEPITIPYPTANTADVQSNVILSYPSDYERSKDPINDRAWTFQELLLSTRAIVFSYRGVRMIDRESETDERGLTSSKDTQLPSLPFSGPMFSLTRDPEQTRQVWLAVRGEYSRRNLTCQGDKLLAIAAVAEELGRTYNSRYFAGLWERDLALDLQWKCLRSANTAGREKSRKPRNKDYVAPSWSWASVDAFIEDFVHVWEEEGDDGGVGFKESLDFEVISCDIELVVPDFTYGAVKSGLLTAKGRLCSFIWRPHKDDESHNISDTDGSLVREVDYDTSLYKELVCGEATIDALDAELQDGVEVICLATRLIENVPGRDDVEGLMLLPVDEDRYKDRYRRVGFFNLNSPVIFEKLEPEKITIV